MVYLLKPHDQISGIKTMQHYIKVAFRIIKREKVSSVISIAGLTVGITCFIILSLFVLDEIGYDSYNKYAGNTYRTNLKAQINGSGHTSSKTSHLLIPVLYENYPEVRYCTAIGYPGGFNILLGNRVIKEFGVYAADTSYFKVFTHHFISGNAAVALSKPNSVVLTKTFAAKLFGSKDAFGKTLHTQQGADYLITGVIEDFPRNSSFNCNMLVSMNSFEITGRWTDAWYSIFVVLKDGSKPAAFENKLQDVVKHHMGPVYMQLLGNSIDQFFAKGNELRLCMQPLEKIYLYSREYGLDPNNEWGEKHGEIAYVYIFSGVAVFILLLAIINFINLATARSENRAREAGIRKTLGSSRIRLIFQFMCEAIIMTTISVVIAAAITEMVLPVFNNFTERNLEFNVPDLSILPVAAGFILIVGTLAGSYPAFFLSSFAPVQVLKGGNSKIRRKSRLRSILVVLQFSISITLLSGTLIINDQMDYIQKKNLGFRKDHLVVIENAQLLGSRKQEFKNDLAPDPHIISSSSCSRFFGPGIPGDGYLFNQSTGTDPIFCMAVEGDHDFLKTFEIKMKSGRYFSRAFPTDSAAVVINEAAAAELNDKNPLGKELIDCDERLKGTRYKIIGIMHNFNFESLHQQVRPLVMHIAIPAWEIPRTITIRISPDNVQQTLTRIKKIWHTYVHEEQPDITFVDERLNQLYNSEVKTGIIALVFTLLSIFIACLGLFGLSAFITEQRTKEIGIRKALGASVSEIILLLSKEFALWVILANIVAWPAVWYLMNTWLQNFAFRTSINPFLLIAAGAATLVIALITVIIHIIKAADMNPVKSLKWE